MTGADVSSCSALSYGKCAVFMRLPKKNGLLDGEEFYYYWLRQPSKHDKINKTIMIKCFWLRLTFVDRSAWPRKNVSNATIMKLTPPAKSVILSICSVAAIEKKITCMTTIIMALTPKWSTSSRFNPILLLAGIFCLLCLVDLFFYRSLNGSAVANAARSLSLALPSAKRAN